MATPNAATRSNRGRRAAAKPQDTKPQLASVPEPKPEATPEPALEAPAQPVNKPGNPNLFASLAEGAKEVKTMPKAARGGGNNTVKPLADLIARSHAEKKPFELPGVKANDKELARLKAGIRRAAASKDLGVAIRHEYRDDLVFISLQGKAKGAKA